MYSSINIYIFLNPQAYLAPASYNDSDISCMSCILLYELDCLFERKKKFYTKQQPSLCFNKAKVKLQYIKYRNHNLSAILIGVYAAMGKCLEVITL